MNQDHTLIRHLRAGKVAVIPTDTLYGIVARVARPEAVNHIYNLRRRTPSKPCIILISELGQLEGLGITPTVLQRSMLERLWPNPISIILPTHRSDLEYLHRGTNTLAVRLPDSRELRELITQTGPLIAPSANHEGFPPAETIEQAKAYFGEEHVQYIDGGLRQAQPSGLIDLSGTVPTILRPIPNGITF
ncbi:MAG: L-threonylcarbamoyladenylate synthase [Candidatus Saccharibacteria bacterium]